MSDEVNVLGELIKYAVYYDKRKKHIKVHLVGKHRLFRANRKYKSPVDSWAFFMTQDDSKMFVKAMHNDYPQLPIEPCKLCEI